METIITACISGACSIIAALIALAVASSKMQKQLEISLAVIQTKLEALTNEVRAHNEFSRRMPVIEEQIKVINHRLEDLEHEKGA